MWTIWNFGITARKIDLILSDEQIFTKWLDDEKRFVNHRYDEIMNSNDAFSIDYGFVEEGQTQPTKSAENLTNLFDGITLSYEDLPLKYQLKFLSDVQLKLLNFYYEIDQKVKGEKRGEC